LAEVSSGLTSCVPDIATDILSDDEFSIYISKYLFSTHGAKYQKSFRFDGKLLCGQPAPPVTVSEEVQRNHYHHHHHHSSSSSGGGGDGNGSSHSEC
jgi:hypothetical protein